MKKRLFDLKTIQDRAKFAQGLMLSKLDGARENRLLDEAIHTMIDKNASYNMVELAGNLFISTRQKGIWRLICILSEDWHIKNADAIIKNGYVEVLV